VHTAPASAMARLTRDLAAGDILLLHDHRPTVLSVLPGVLATLTGSGLDSVTLRAGLEPPLAQQPCHHQTNMHKGQ
jgi:hypothetical protein